MKKDYSRIISISLFAVFLMALVMTSSGDCRAEMSATQIIKKCDSLLRGKTSRGESRMNVITPNWERTIDMKYWSDGTEKFFIHIMNPARERGTTFLKAGHLLYQWLPSAEMEIKITPSMMLQSWMGSDFTNDDLVKESSMVKDYTHKLLGKEKIEGAECYKIQCTPKPNAPVVWGKLLMWVETSNMIPRREEFYNEKGALIKRMNFSDIKQTNDRPYPMTWTMVPLNKKGHKTIYRIIKVEFNKRISPQIFTKRNMRKPR